jgi:4-amino-4-deoxy-L-arabinose transferase-like glycosyltransferase
VLAPVSSLSGASPNAQRLTMAVLGTVGVALVGLLGRTVTGERTGLVAAGIAAVYPNLWVNDGLVMAETLSVLAVVLALLLAYRFIRHPTVGTGLALGAVCGAAALISGELILLAPLLALPTVLLARSITRPERIEHLLILFGALALIVGPWVVFNLGRFESPTFLSTDDGVLLLGANCDAVYHGDATGLWQRDCLPEVRGDQSTANAAYRTDALQYIRDHADRFPAVVVARIGRTWGLFHPGAMRSYGEREGRESWVTSAGLWFYYPLLLLAIAGIVVMRHRFDHLWQLLVPFVIVTLVSIATYGQTRFRVPAEPSLVVLAAIAIDAFFPGKVVVRGPRTGRATREGVLEPSA